MSTLALDNTYSFSVQSDNRGESPAAKRIEACLKLATNHFGAASVMKQSALESIAEIFATCQEVAWDGHSARPLLPSSFESATKFLQILPSWVPVPEITPEPDGEIALEWRHGSSIFSVSMGADRTLSYAGILGYKKKIHGTEPFDDSIPPVVLECIRRLLQAQ